MILSEDGLRKIIRDSIRMRDPEGPEFRSSDRVYKCNLDNLRNAPEDSIVSKIIFFLNRLLYFNPVGVSKKSFLEQLDLFFTTGLTLTPEENEQYNASIRSALTSSDKEEMINKIETGLDLLFFPSAAPVCKIVDGYFKNLKSSAAGLGKTSAPGIDTSSFVKALEKSSELMLNRFGLRGIRPMFQILYPETFYLSSKNSQAEDIRRAAQKETENIQKTIMLMRSQDSKDLFRAIQKIHIGVGKRRDRSFYFSPLEKYFNELDRANLADDVTNANELKRVINDLISNNPITI